MHSRNGTDFFELPVQCRINALESGNLIDVYITYPSNPQRITMLNAPLPEVYSSSDEMMSYALASSSKQDKEKNKERVKPKLKVVPKGTLRPPVNPAEFEKPIQPPSPIDPNNNNGFFDADSKAIDAFNFIQERVKYVGFTQEQQLEIGKRLFMTIAWKPCVDAYKASPGVQATPGEVLRDRGIT